MPLKTLANVPGLRWWVDIDDVDNTTIVGGKLAGFTDKSASGINGTQATDTYRPTMSTMGSKAIAVADGTNDFLDITSGVPVTSDMAIAVVLTRSTAGTRFWSIGSSLSSYFPHALHWYTDNSIGCALGTSSTAFGTSTDTGNFILVGARTASLMWVRKGGEDFGAPVVAPTVGSTKFVYVFRGYTTYGSGGIGEIAVFPTSEIELVEGILAWDWGLTLPSSHTYYSAAPEYDADSGVDGVLSGTLKLSGVIANLTYNADMAGSLSLSGAIAASTYNASISASFKLSGIIEAGYTNLEILGRLKLGGIIAAENEAIGAISGSLTLSGIFEAATISPAEMIGVFSLNGLMGAELNTVGSMTGSLRLSGYMSADSSRMAEITGTLKLHSYIIANNGATACTIQPYGSSLWC